MIWTGLKTPKGYGSVRVDGRLWRTHRLAWELTKGPIPEGLLLRHTCDMPACVELDHLELGTAAENTADMLERNRARRGESCSWAKMSDALVTEIRSRLSPPRYGLVRDLAAEYGLDPSIISMIREGRKWSHITGGVALPAYGKKRHAPA